MALDSNGVDDKPPATSITDWLSRYLMEQIRVHGISFFLLGVMVWYFQSENAKIKAQILACNDSLIEMYRTDRMQLLDVINNNTKAINSLKLDH